MRRLSTDDARGIADRVNLGASFDTHGAVRGEAEPRWVSTGYLPRNEARRLDRHRARIDYVIYSYGTPIAYRVRPVDGPDRRGDDAGTWIVPDCRYSITTSRHQSTVRWALSLTGEGVRA